MLGSLTYTRNIAIILFTFVRAASFVRRFHDESSGKSKEDDNPMNYGPLDFLVNIGAIVYVEMALKWNNISGVHSLATPGQFMPFFIALAQLLSVFYGFTSTALDLAADDVSFSDFGNEGTVFLLDQSFESMDFIY